MSEEKECSTKGCNNKVFKGYNQCILHCDKSDSPNGFEDYSLEEFFNALVDHVIDSLTNRTNFSELNVSKQNLKLFFKGKRNVQTNFNAQKIKHRNQSFKNIKFPDRNEFDSSDYLSILQKFGSLEFYKCEFNTTYLDLEGCKCHFSECEFNTKWCVSDSALINDTNSIYYSCNFQDEVFSNPEHEKEYTLRNNLFQECNFKKEVEFNNTKFEGKIFFDQYDQHDLFSLRLDGCLVEKDINIIDVPRATRISFSNTLFNARFNLRNIGMNELEINDCVFKGISDFTFCRPLSSIIKNTVFEEISIFDYFRSDRIENLDSCEMPSRFEYVTFLSTVSFRRTDFSNGLDIENTNFKEYPNFLDTEIEFENTNRETFRIIKNAFDKVGNHIEANKFFALELKKYKQEIESTNRKREKVIFWLNEFSSDFGQNYWKPIKLILIFSIVYCVLIIGHEKNWLYKIYPDLNNVLSFVSSLFNSLAKGFIPFQKLLREGMEFLSLLFGILFSGLIWQALVAIKRHTRR